MKRVDLLTVALLFFCTPQIADAKQLYVPTIFPSIQTALNSAVVGDTIFVEQGVYSENIFWPETDSLHLFSLGDSTNTTIDGRRLAPVISVLNSDTSNLRTFSIRNFRITNGYSPQVGGCITATNAVGILEGVKIDRCEAFEKGGGIYSDGGRMYISVSEISNNLVTENSSSNFRGGGGYFSNTVTEITSSTITKNVSYAAGGLHITSGRILLDSVSVSYNTASSRDGGLYIGGYEFVSISNSSIIGNSATQVGGLTLGGIHRDSTLFSRNVVQDNVATIHF